MSREEYKDAIEVSVIFHEGQRMFAVPKQPAPVQEPAWWPAVENILKEYGLQAIDFVADFKAAMAEQPAQRTWVGLSDLNIDELENEYMKSAQTAHQFLRAVEAKLKEKNT
jgi:hypothetical protein